MLLKKRAVFWFKMSPKALEISVSLCTTRSFTFEREILRQTVLIPSNRKNFVKNRLIHRDIPDSYTWISSLFYFESYSTSKFKHTLLFINENNCLPCFLYQNKPQDHYGIPFEHPRVLLLTLWFNSQNRLVKARSCEPQWGMPLFYVSFFCLKQLFFSKKHSTLSYKTIYN